MKAGSNILLMIILFTCGVCRSQVADNMLENNASWYVQKHLHTMNVYHHTAIRPYVLNDTVAEKVFAEKKALCDKFLPTPFLNKNQNFRFLVLPTFGYNYEKYSGTTDTVVSDVSGGIMGSIAYKSMLSFSGDFTAYKGTFSPYMIHKFDTMGIMPGNGIRYNGTPGKFYYENWNAVLNFSPNRFINVQLGRGKNFWGYGYRSLFLSDNATAYPYAKFTAAFWHIQYVSMVAQMKDIRGAYGNPSDYFTKYGTFHLLSWNVTKRWNINIFESVIWQAKDTLQNRQLDIHYLNPVIFYRPVEFSLGSSDNSILGLGSQVKINDNISIYGQGLLDEFVLDQIKADSGWWANKYGLQVGFKAFEPFKLKGFYFQTEYNAVRPFTYSHGSIYQNYAHFNQPLAHPMGANFRDWVTIAQYHYKWVTISNKLVIANYGLDSAGRNYGGNLFESYKTRAQDYHNYIGQGQNNELFYNKFSVELLLVKQNNLRIEFAYTLRKVKNEAQTITTNFFSFGISTNLYNKYNDY